MAAKEKNYSRSYSEKRFWEKMKKFALTIGKELAINVLKLYYAMALGKATPAQITAIIAALGYFISPVDAIPDLTPAVGFADDGGVIALAVSMIAACSDKEVVSAAKSKAAEWFKED